MQSHPALMSHRILKSNAPGHRGLLSDFSDMAESYWCWAKNKVTVPWASRKEEWTIPEFGNGNGKTTRCVGDRDKNQFQEWTISEFETANKTVRHAGDDTDGDASV
jgi:hypothetical protein